VVRAEVERLLVAGISDVRVVAPYNAQVNALREALLEVNCRTIPQMRLANALCRFVELAA
jgi:hypothetical protein